MRDMKKSCYTSLTLNRMKNMEEDSNKRIKKGVYWWNILWWNGCFKNSSSLQWGPWAVWFYLLFYSVNGQMNGGLHLCISPFLSLSVFSRSSFLRACLLSIYILSVSSPLLSLVSAVSLSLAPGARWWKRMCAGLEEHASGIYTASRMKDSWCSQGCVWVFVSVCVCVCIWGRDGVVGWEWKKGTRRDREKGK